VGGGSALHQLCEETMFREFSMAVVLVGGSVFMFFFGTNGIVLFLYSFLPTDTQEYLWNNYPPERFGIGYDAQFTVGVVMLLVGLWYSFGVWAAYPTLRGWLVGTVVLMWLGTAIMVHLTYGHLSYG